MAGMTTTALEGLRIRKLADKSGPRPAEGMPWPLAGIRILNDEVPREVVLSTGFVRAAMVEGWMTGEGEEWVVRPAGPAAAPMSETHSFAHYDRLTIHAQDDAGDDMPLTFKVTHQPDKYADADAINEGDGVDEVGPTTDKTKVTRRHYDAGATRVDHFYRLKLEGASRG